MSFFLELLIGILGFMAVSIIIIEIQWKKKTDRIFADAEKNGENVYVSDL